MDNFEYSGDDFVGDYDNIKKITNIQLYILENEEWKPSTKWTVNGWGISEFCHDSNGNLYMLYCDTVGNGSSDGSTLYRLGQNGSVESTLLEDKDIMSIRIPSPLNDEMKKGI